MKSSSRRSCHEENGSLAVKATRCTHLPLSPRQGQTPSPAPGSVCWSGLLIVSCDGCKGAGPRSKPNDNQLAGLPACRCLFRFLCTFYGFISGTWLLSSPPPSLVQLVVAHDFPFVLAKVVNIFRAGSTARPQVEQRECSCKCQDFEMHRLIGSRSGCLWRWWKWRWRWRRRWCWQCTWPPSGLVPPLNSAPDWQLVQLSDFSRP